MKPSSLLILLVSLAGLCGCQQLKVTARVWNPASPASSDDDRLLYPETENPAAYGLEGKADLGICFSGGGTRSAAASLGQMRALEELGIMRRVRFIAGVSGGGWAVIPYSFLPMRIKDSTFLGPYIPPRGFDLAALQAPAPAGSLASAISDSNITFRYAEKALAFRADETYAGALGEIFLKPFGLHDPRKFFTLNEKTFRDIAARNPGLAQKDFYLQRPGRPFMIIGGTVRSYKGSLGFRTSENNIPVEYTSLYSGIVPYFRGAGSKAASLGSTLVESFAYDSSKPVRDEKDRNLYHVRLQQDLFTRNAPQLSLSDIAASTGAAPGAYAIAFVTGFPKFDAWSIKPDPVNPPSAEYAHMDGGMNDIMGIMPLLARGVKNIIVFFNTSSASEFHPPVIAVPEMSEQEVKCIGVPEQLPALFGKLSDNYVRTTYGFTHVDGPLYENQVFAPEGYNRMLRDFQEDYKGGRPYFHCGEYRVLRNDFWKIKGGYTVKICWFMLGPAKLQASGQHPAGLAPHQKEANERVQLEWIRELPHSTRLVFDPTYHPGDPRPREAAAFKTFPLYATFMANRNRVIDLDPAQVNALSQYTSWSVKKNAGALKKHLGL